MKKNTVYLIFMLLFSCSPSPEQKAKKIIEDSIDFHDPQSEWKQISEISVEKQQLNYDREGMLISQTIFLHEFWLKPFFEAKNIWEKDSIKHRVTFDGLKVSYQMGDNEVLNESFLKSKKNEIQMAFEDIMMPMSFLASNYTFTYQNSHSKYGKKEAEVVKVQKEIGNDIEVYFLPKSYQLIGYKQKAKGEYEVVNTIELQNYKGLNLPAKKEIFAADSLGNHLYLKSVVTFRYFD